MRIEGHVGPARAVDGQEGLPFRQGNSGEQILSGLNPNYFEHVMRGNAFIYSTALAGNALVIAGSTNVPALWNPSGSGKNLVLMKVAIARTAKGTPLEGSITYLTLPNAGATIGTGNQIVSLTQVAPVNLLIGAGNASVIRFAPTTINTGGIPTLVATAGFGQTADNGATTVSGPRVDTSIDYIDGMIVVPPGNTFQMGAAVSVSTTYTISIFGLELPVPQTAS